MASNVSGNAYALTVLSPIKNAYTEDEIAYADLVRDHLQSWNDEENSPMALVPNTYLCRYFVLDDVVNQSLPGGGALDTISDFLPLVPDSIRRSALPYEDHLQSPYLVFSCNFYCGPGGDPDPYLRAMWNTISERIKEVWGHCYGFEGVNTAETFIAYIKRCSLPPSLFFVGSNDDSLAEQLKALYLKQEFSKFAVENQGLEASDLKIKLQAFMERVAPGNLSAPTWSAGKYKL